MKTKWLLSAAICLATFHLSATSPVDAKKKNDALLKDVSVDAKLPKESLKIEKILEDKKPEEVSNLIVMTTVLTS
jgi:hypothetical protein